MVRVLQSARRPMPTENQYVQLLAGSLPASVECNYFTWRRALFSRYDVLHLHWPELLYTSRRPVAALLKRALAVLLVARLRLCRTRVVRTVHNLSPHDGSGGRLDRWLAKAFDSATTVCIGMTTGTPVIAGRPVVQIPHGKYPVSPTAPTVRSRIPTLLFFGLVRPYKGVEQLIAACDHMSTSAELRICGAPLDPEFGARVTALAAGNPRITTDLRALAVDELQQALAAADAVVLPYTSMFNSGSLLHALSATRPVLVPDSTITRALRDEVGEAWVHTFTGELGGATLDAFVAETSVAPPTGPDLSRREWSELGPQIAAVYQLAVGSTDPAQRAR